MLYRWATIHPLIACTLASLLAIVLTSARCGSADAQPKQLGPREIVSPLPDATMTLPAARECGMATITTTGGTIIHVPRQGQFVQHCAAWRIVDGKNNTLSLGQRCGPPVFTSC